MALCILKLTSDQVRCDQDTYVCMYVCIDVCMYEIHAVARNQFNKLACKLRASNSPPLGTNYMQESAPACCACVRKKQQIIMHFACLEFAVCSRVLAVKLRQPRSQLRHMQRRNRIVSDEPLQACHVFNASLGS